MREDISQDDAADEGRKSDPPTPQKRSAAHGLVGEAELDEAAPPFPIVLFELAGPLGDLDQIRVRQLDLLSVLRTARDLLRPGAIPRRTCARTCGGRHAKTGARNTRVSCT